MDLARLWRKVRARLGPYRGQVDHFDTARVAGWVTRKRASDQPVALHLRVDGAVVADLVADLVRADVAQAGLGPARCGYDLALPGAVRDRLGDGAAHQVTLCPKGQSRPLPGAVLSLGGAGAPKGGAERAGLTCQGFVEKIGANGVSGWAYQPGAAADAPPVMIALRMDGRAIAVAEAVLPRADVAETGGAPLHSGFAFEMPAIFHDGQTHQIEVVENATGARLPGGLAELGGRFEGVAFLDPGTRAITGWAAGCDAVRIALDDGAPVSVPLGRDVPGFAEGNGQGFVFPVPAALIDGAWHSAQVTFGTSDQPLDAAPVAFRLDKALPRVRIARIVGRRVEARVQDADGAPLDLRPGVVIDDVRVMRARSLGDIGAPEDLDDLDALEDVPAMPLGPSGRITFALPEGARDLVLTDERVHPPRPIARFVVGQGRAALRPAPLEGQVLSAKTLDDAFCATARATWEAFCDGQPAQKGGVAFDPAWYVTQHPGEDWPATPLPASDPALRAAALAHYRTAAKDGASPSPWFDEAGLRQRLPVLDAAIAKGRLPAAFAAHLVLGTLPGAPGAQAAMRALAAQDAADLVARIETLADTEGALARAKARHIAALPAPTDERAAASSIYTAWMDRLQMTRDMRDRVRTDEAAARTEIASQALTHQPLVSIIMPTWNRAYTIGEAIQSALDQSYGHWELLICDDASDDKTASVVAAFGDPRIRYLPFLKSNGAGARNKGLGFARGDYIAYLDSDNLWNPLFLDLMLRRLMASPGQPIAYSGYLDTETVGAEVRCLIMSYPEFRPVQLAGKNFMDLNTIVHHRRVFDWLGGFDGSLPRLQDWDLMLRYTSIFRPLFVPLAMVYYRRNVAWGQVTHVHQGSNAQNVVNAKTNRRLAGDHARLGLDWPSRGRLTLVVGAQGARVQDMAVCLARLAAPLADVHWVDVTGGAAPQIEGVQTQRLGPDLAGEPARAAHARPDLFQSGPVLAVGQDAPFLAALSPDLGWSLDQDGQGLLLRSGAGLCFPLGALPLGLPRRRPDPSGRPLVLVLPTEDGAAESVELAALAADEGLDVMLPPQGQSARWTCLAGGHAVDPGPLDAAGRPRRLADLALGIVLRPVSALSPWELSLLAALQSQAIPLAVLPELDEAAPDTLAGSLGDQWIATRSAYRIQVPQAEWILNKAAKLLRAEVAYADLSARSLRAWQITSHDALVAERLAYWLWRTTFAPPASEIAHVAP